MILLARQKNIHLLVFIFVLTLGCGETTESSSNTMERDHTEQNDGSHENTMSDEQDRVMPDPMQMDTSSMDMWIEGCPPEGPYGKEAGDTATDITLYQCDGTPVSLHSLCGKTAAYVYTYADWCPSCRNFAADGKANDLYNQYKDHNFAMWFVITATSDTQPPGRRDCQTMKERYQLEMTVLYDANSVTNSVLGMRANTADMVLGEKNKIVTNGPWAFAIVENALRDIYGF